MIYQSAKVICNDYNNYMKRLQNIQSTQELIRKISDVVIEERNQKISDYTKAQIDDIILNHEEFVDLITLSSNLLYLSYTLTDIKELLSHEFYDILVRAEYDPKIDHYMEKILIII